MTQDSRYQRLLDYIEIKLEKSSSYLESHFNLTLALLFLFALGIRLLYTPFNMALREDAYVYLLKAIEITRGNFIPIKTQSIGWSLFMAPVFYIHTASSIFDNMFVARIISNLVGTAVIFPLHGIGKLVFDRRGQIVLLLLFCITAPLISVSGSVYAEPLFILLLVTTIYLIAISVGGRIRLVSISVCGALCYYVRPEGVFLLPLILAALFIFRKRFTNFSYMKLFYVALIFTVACGPFLYQRYHHFGSPFTYGDNDKFFVESYKDVWSLNVKPPTITEYIRTHDINDYYSKFISEGFFKVILKYIHSTIHPIILLFFIYGLVVRVREKYFILPGLVIGAWIIFLTPVYSIFEGCRHLYPTIPFMLVFAAAGINDTIGRARYKTILTILLLILTMHFANLECIKEKSKWKRDKINAGLEWGKWAAENIRGKIAIVEGEDMIMINLEDATVGGVGQHYLYAPDTGLSVIRPGNFQSLNVAMGWLRRSGTTHIAFDERFIGRRPYLKELFPDGRPASFLEKIYSNYGKNTAWPIEFYRIDWESYEKTGTVEKDRATGER